MIVANIPFAGHLTTIKETDWVLFGEGGLIITATDDIIKTNFERESNNE